MAMIDAAPATPELNPRRATIDLAAADLKQIAKLKPGTPVRVTLRGTVKEVRQSEGDGDDRKDYGYLRLELTKINATEVGGSSIDELIDEE
jgi:hypothetical protein